MPTGGHAGVAGVAVLLRGTASGASVTSGGGPTLPRIGDLGGAAMAGKREAHELLLIEEADAWFEYLETTRGQTATRYKEIEPWAWARLRQRLRAVNARREKLRAAA
jgi:hypothetical protein